MSVEWSELPPEIVEAISRRLTVYEDYIRFRSVCRSWRFSVPEIPHNLPPQLPWLMLPPSQSSTYQSRRAFFNLSNNRTHFLDLPEASHHRRPCGSSHGWLVLVDETPEILLLNPLTRAKLHLPPLYTFPNVVGFNFSDVGREHVTRNRNGHLYTQNLRQMRDYFIIKVVLSSSPLQSDRFTALAILADPNLAFCKNGDDSWTFIDEAQHCWVDAVYHDGKFYAVEIEGKIAVLDVHDPCAPRFEILDTKGRCAGYMQYLVFSGNELLLVNRYLEDDSDDKRGDWNLLYMTVGFNVCKMDWSASKWQKIKGLGDQMLFIGGNSSFSLPASDFPGCYGDCIYYADNYYSDDYLEFNCDGLSGKHDTGIYRLWDRSIEPLLSYPPNTYSRLGWPPTIWVSPSPC